MEIKKKYKGRLLCITKQYMLFYRKGNLIVRYSNNEKVLCETKIGGSVEKISIFARLLRSEPRCAVMLNEQIALISYKGRIYRYDIPLNRLSVEHEYVAGMNNPLTFCVREKDNGEKEIFYGEYLWNERKGPVAIYKRDSECWSKIYEFPANSITHIHGIVYDKSKAKFYILTGDTDEESGIWVTDDEFATVHPICIGKQIYRACVAFSFGDGLIYATDTPLEDNHIFKLTEEVGCVAKLTLLHDIAGSCIYGGKIGGKYFFSTTVEPDSTCPKWKYRFTYRLGKGINDRYS